MKISIIVPVYNTPEKYLATCFDSIRKQTENSFEVIIIDDGSEKETAKYLDIWEKKDQRFHVFHTKNKGVSAARNVGIKKASGEWLTFVDADDYIEYNMLSEAIRIVEENAADISMWRFDQLKDGHCINTRFVGENKMEFIGDQIEKLERMLLNFYKYSDEIQFTSLPTTVCKMYKTGLIKKYNVLFNENVKIAEDAIFTFEAINYTKKVVFENKILYHYRQWKESSSQNYNPEVIDNWINTRYELKRVLEKTGKYNLYETDYNYHALEALKILLFTVIIKENNLKIQKEELKRILKTDVFCESLKKLEYKNVYGIKGKAVLFLAKLKCYKLLIIGTRLRAGIVNCLSVIHKT